MQVIRLEEASGGRYIVYMEDGISFPIGRKEGKNLELEEGKELSADQLEWIFNELVFPRGRNYLICLLAGKDYTIKEVRDKLVKACYPPSVIEDIICYGVEKHYLDDFRYASDYIRLRKSGKSIRQLKYQLSMKGISSVVLSQIEEQNEEEDLYPKICRYMERQKGNEYERKAKTYQYFVRKGYNSSFIKEIIGKLNITNKN